MLSTIQHMETLNFDLYMFSDRNVNLISSQVKTGSFIGVHFLNTLAIASNFTACTSANPQHFLPKQNYSGHFYDNIFICLIVARKA